MGRIRRPMRRRATASSACCSWIATANGPPRSPPATTTSRCALPERARRTCAPHWRAPIAVVNAASHRLDLPVMRACLEIGARCTDLGGLCYYAIEQYELDEAFREAGLSAAISMGAAPASPTCSPRRPWRSLTPVETIEVIDAVVAGRRVRPDEPFVPGRPPPTRLIDEFTQPAPMFIDGREQLMKAAGGARTYHLPEGDVECVYTIHSEPATLPRSYADRGIRTVEWRLGLPPAHTLPLRALVAAGMASAEPCRWAATRCARATCSSPCSPARAGRRTTRRARAPARPRRRHARRPAPGDRRRPPSRSTPRGAPTRARTRHGVPPSIAAQLLAGGQRCARASAAPR